MSVIAEIVSSFSLYSVCALVWSFESASIGGQIHY